MNPVTSHLDTFELPVFYFFKFKTLSPYVEIQKSRLDALKKKKLNLKTIFEIRKKILCVFLLKKTFGALNQTNLIWDIIWPGVIVLLNWAGRKYILLIFR